MFDCARFSSCITAKSIFVKFVKGELTVTSAADWRLSLPSPCASQDQDVVRYPCVTETWIHVPTSLALCQLFAFRTVVQNHHGRTVCSSVLRARARVWNCFLLSYSLRSLFFLHSTLACRRSGRWCWCARSGTKFGFASRIRTSDIPQTHRSSVVPPYPKLQSFECSHVSPACPSDWRCVGKS